MVSGASPALTTISFRRDVRLFFGALVGFLAFLIFFQLLLLQNFLSHARETTWENWSNTVRMSIDDIMRSNILADPVSAAGQLSILQQRYGMAGLTVMHGGREITAGVPPAADNVERLVRTVQGSTVIFVFDASQLKTMTVTFWTTTAISLLATTIGMIRDTVGLAQLEPNDFVQAVLARIPPNPPNHSLIIELNERGELPDNLSELEAGANRCAVV